MAQEFHLDDWQDFEDDPFLSPRLKQALIDRHNAASGEADKLTIKRVTLILCSVALFLALHFMTESIAAADARNEGFRSGFRASQMEHPANGICIPGT
jgi:hypothetical protein